jgi:outer membrane protein OmpA-like peptidoglycan-associated protein
MTKYLFFIFLLTTFGLNAQLKAKIADDHFVRMEYAKCVDMYNELANKTLKSKDKDENDWEYVRRAGICNYHLYRMNGSIGYFMQLKQNNKLTEADRELLLKALRFNANYTDAYSIALESSNLYPQNKFFLLMKENNDRFNSLIEDSLRFRISDALGNSGMGDFSPTVSNNRVYYATKSSNTKAIHTTYGWDDSYFLNIKYAGLTSDSTFDEGTLLRNSFISKAHDGPVSFSSDGQKMVITRNAVEKIKGRDVVRLSIYFSEFINNEWSEPVAFKYNDKNFNTGHAVFAEKDKAIYFVSDKTGGFGEADIYVSRLGNDGSWLEPINLGPGINTSEDELFPFVAGTTLFFASNGHFGMGGLDLFEIDLNAGNQPKNMGYPVNTSHDDFGIWTDSTNNKGFFSTNRGDNVDRIMAFKRLPITIDLQGIVYATYNEREAIPSQVVTVKNETSGKVDSLVTNEFGQFQMRLKKGESYSVSTSKEDFILIKDGFISTEGIQQDTTLFCELPLKPTTLQVRLRVIELGTKKVIPYAKTTVTDYAINKESVLYTDDNGLVTIKVDRNKSYWAHASKKGFVDDNIAFNSANENDKIIDLELKLPPIVKGDIFKLENIFYDLNKSTLRPESMLALDKLADFIIKNEVKIELSSHTDARGSDAYNLKLSQARAQSCVDYLISKGVKKNQMIAKGYGETKLINRCKNNVTCPEEMHQENRRTEVKIL